MALSLVRGVQSRWEAQSFPLRYVQDLHQKRVCKTAPALDFNLLPGLRGNHRHAVSELDDEVEPLRALNPQTLLQDLGR